MLHIHLVSSNQPKFAANQPKLFAESKDLLGTPEKIMQHYKRQKEKGTTIVQGDNWLDANFLIGDSSLFLRFMRLVSSLRDQQYFLDRLKSEKTKKMMQAAHATADMLVIAGQCGMTLEDSEDAIKEPLYRPFHLFVRDLFFSSFWIDIETTQGGTEDVLAEQSREWEEKTTTKREDEEDKQLMKLFFMMSQDEDRQGQSKTRRRIEELWEKQKVATEFKDLLCQMDDVITRVRGQAKPVMVSIEDATLLERGFAAIISFLTRADSSTL